MLLGFDALGRWPLASLPGNTALTFTLVADTGSFGFTGNAAAFKVLQPAAVGAFAFTGVSTSFQVRQPAAPASYTVTGNAVGFKVNFALATGAFAAGGPAGNEVFRWSFETGAFAFSGSDVKFRRDGFDYDFQQGGIGHLLLEAEEAKRLAAITRKAPPPVDLRSKPSFPPLAASPVRPPAPVVDMAAVQAERMADEMRAAETAKKRRRDEEAILLLAC